MNVSRLLSGKAARWPTRTALVFEDRSFSYAELELRARRAAGALAGLGVGEGDRVALFSKNRPEWIEVFFGLAKLGAVVVPVNFRLTPDEVSQVLAHSAPKLLVFELELAGALPADSDLPALDLDGAYGTLVDEATPVASEALVHDTDAHSIGYTSGTTGRAKGAVLTHANMVVGTHYYSMSNLGYTREDVFLNPTPLCHRAGCARMIQSFGVGAPMVLLRRFDPERVFDLIERHRVTMSGFVPTMVRLMSQHRGKADVTSMRQLLTTGEACPPSTRELVFELFPGVELLTTFASTEAGIIAVSSSADERVGARPLPEVDLRFEEDGEILVRAGEPGRGGVLREYWNDPEANAEAFRDGWFATGDCGFLDEAGRLHVVDRKKDMILSGGLNIYSKEVEGCLLEHPAVLEAAVVGEPDPTWGESVVAYVVKRAGSDVGAEELVAHCRERLASYKKPREIRFRSALPQNTVGKVLKYRLREKETS